MHAVDAVRSSRPATHETVRTVAFAALWSLPAALLATGSMVAVFAASTPAAAGTYALWSNRMLVPTPVRQSTFCVPPVAVAVAAFGAWAAGPIFVAVTALVICCVSMVLDYNWSIPTTPLRPVHKPLPATVQLVAVTSYADPRDGCVLDLVCQPNGVVPPLLSVHLPFGDLDDAARVDVVFLLDDWKDEGRQLELTLTSNSWQLADGTTRISGVLPAGRSPSDKFV